MKGLTSNEWQSGDATAFQVLFEQYKNLVFKSAYLITGNREEAEDILQEVFVAVWQFRHTYNPDKGKLATWLHKITVNKCLESKRRKRVPFAYLEGIDTPEARFTDEIPVSKQEYERLIEAMNSLDIKHRAVLVLRYFSDLSYQEIAQTVGIPLGTVKSRIHHGLELLRGKFDMQKREALG